MAEALKRHLSKLDGQSTRFVVRVDGGVTVQHIAFGPDGEVASMVEQTLGPESRIDGTVEHLELWAEAFAQLQQRGSELVLHTLPPLLAHQPLATVEAFAAAMVDEPLIAALGQAHESDWWEGCETEWQTAWQAAALGNFVVLEQLFEKSPALVTTRGEFGFTLLHQVAERCDAFSPEGSLRCIDLLIRLGADVNAATDDGVRPLHIARKEVVRCLLSHGAELEARDDRGSTPLIVQSTERDGLGPMRALLENGADANARDAAGKSAADHAKHRNELEKLELLARYSS